MTCAVQQPLWELACLRCQQRGLADRPWRLNREQARSHSMCADFSGSSWHWPSGMHRGQRRRPS
ncbi:hypothetical protein EU514_03095 [Pseudomonas fragi]|nr:hypothetical protein [Pseudomonas fragi]